MSLVRARCGWCSSHASPSEPFILTSQRTLQPTSSYKHSVDPSLDAARQGKCYPTMLHTSELRTKLEARTTAWSSAITDTQVTTYIANTGATWHFIPAHAPWMGGVYERMVGQVKRCLRKILGTARLQLTQLHTVLLETEAIVNTRPLLYVTPDETQSTLSPADFLQSHTSLGVPILPSEDHEKKKKKKKKKKGPRLSSNQQPLHRKHSSGSLEEGAKATHPLLDDLEGRIFDKPQRVTPCPPVATTIRDGPTSLHRRCSPDPGQDLPRFVETQSYHSPDHQPRWADSVS